MVGKRVQFDHKTWASVDLLSKDRMMTFQELADEAFRDILKKYNRPTSLKEALRKSAAVSGDVVPLKAAMAASRPNVRLLNAARHQGLAARTRTALLDRGWRKIAIGDAAQVRARSIVLYPADRRALGLRVAAQFGFASAINRDSDEVLVLLGRDAASLSFRRAG